MCSTGEEVGPRECGRTRQGRTQMAACCAALSTGVTLQEGRWLMVV